MAQISASAPALLNTDVPGDTGFDFGPVIATDGLGNWVAVWRSDENLFGTAGTDFDIFVSTSSDNGATWSPSALLNTNGASDTGEDSDPVISTDGSGAWVAVWHSTENLSGTAGTDYDILMSTSSDNGGTWSSPALLNSNGTTDTAWDRSPAIAMDGSGTWVTVWGLAVSGSDQDIFVSTSSDNGATWSSPVLLNSNGTTDTHDDYSPEIATDGSGNWVAVWWSPENLFGTAGTDFDTFVSTSSDNGATWSSPALLNTNAASDTEHDEIPVIYVDGSGTWVAAWHSSENLSGTAGTDRDIFVSTSSDSGTTWSSPALLNSNGATDTGDDYFPVITTDGSGAWVAVWHSNENLAGTAGTDFDIFVSTFTVGPAGLPLDARWLLVVIAVLGMAWIAQRRSRRA